MMLIFLYYVQTRRVIMRVVPALSNEVSKLLTAFESPKGNEALAKFVIPIFDAYIFFTETKTFDTAKTNIETFKEGFNFISFGTTVKHFYDNGFDSTHTTFAKLGILIGKGFSSHTIGIKWRVWGPVTLAKEGIEKAGFTNPIQCARKEKNWNKIGGIGLIVGMVLPIIYKVHHAAKMDTTLWLAVIHTAGKVALVAMSKVYPGAEFDISLKNKTPASGSTEKTTRSKLDPRKNKTPASGSTEKITWSKFDPRIHVMDDKLWYQKAAHNLFSISVNTLGLYRVTRPS